MGDPAGDDAAWMALALDEARAAAAAGEVPVGAVLVKDGVLLARGRNAPLALRDPTAHAEVAALRAAAQALDNYRLDGCTLYVTLEPCAMCAGAILHARLARVVYGAPDPRTGAAGSVVDLFADGRLNHQTRVDGDVLGSACGALLQQFFLVRRAEARAVAQPLRDDALRTPVARFDALLMPWPPQYTSELPALDGLRLAWLDTAPAASNVPAGPACVCLHGAGQWSHQVLPLIAALQAAGCARVLAPDLVGFGRSDKPKRDAWHAPQRHRDVLDQWLANVGAAPVVLLACASMRALAEALADALGPRCRGLVRVAEQGDPGDGGDRGNGVAEVARAAPFPDRGHEAALRAFGNAHASRCVGADEARRAAQEAMGYLAA